MCVGSYSVAFNYTLAFSISLYIPSRAVWRALRARPATEMHGAATNAPFPLQENPARYKITRRKVMYWFRESVVFTYKVYWHQFLQHWTHTKNENVSRSCLDFRMRARNKVPKSSQKFPNSAPTQYYITLLCHFKAIWFLLRSSSHYPTCFRAW